MIEALLALHPLENCYHQLFIQLENNMESKREHVANFSKMKIFLNPLCNLLIGHGYSERSV